MGAGSQIGVLAPTQLPANSRIRGYDKQLRAKGLLEDIYAKLSGEYNTEKKSIPNAIYMTISDAALSETEQATITMKLKLRDAAVYGNNFAIGTEELPRTRTMTIYRNNLRKTVSTPGYGKRKLDAAAYGLFEQHIDDLADYAKEHEGLEIRQAGVERYGETLRHGDTQATCVPHWNRNIFVSGNALRSCRPAFSNTLATYTQNIVARVLAAGGGAIAPTVNQTLNQPNLSNASNFALQQRIARLSIPGLPGGRGFILTMSELQATYLGDPAWSQRNLGSLYTQLTSLPEKTQNWPGVLGAYKDFLLVVDPRQPTIVVGGTSEPYSLTAGYMWPGEVDQRSRDDANTLDTFFIWGKGGLANWYPEKLHHIQQVDDYGAIVGHGFGLVRGVSEAIYFDQNSANEEQFTSVLGICRIPDYV
jgi:hypothetical protein